MLNLQKTEAMLVNKIKTVFNKNWQLITNLVVIIFLLILPYYLFEGKLFIGGDDTKLFYSYPFAFLKNVAYFSWYNVSSIGINVSNQYMLPFLSIWTIIDSLIQNKVILSYFAFSLPLIFGFIYFKNFVKELFELDDTYSSELSLGGLFYILSPIIVVNQLFIFLTPIWLLGLVPAISYYFIKYLKSSRFIYIYISMLICFIFAFAILAIPWLLGFILPASIGLIVLIILNKSRKTFSFLKRSLIFTIFIVLTQTFWFLGFIAPYIIQDKNSFAAKFLSKGFLDTFTPTIISTATGNILYPLLNLYHRQIAFDFDWKLKNEFINLYDKTFFINIIYIAIVIFGLINYRKYLTKQNSYNYLFILASFLISLYFFTVNIGPLKDLFIQFGKIPGFVMFRNFYDKFAPGYVFFYAILFTCSLVIIKNKYKNRKTWLHVVIIFTILLNFSSVKSIVTSPLWTTKDVYKTINIPSEYLNFMNKIKQEISPTNTILSVPFGSSVYTVIKDENTDNVYVGTSPVKIFSGVNDISGYLSFLFTKEADQIDKIITDRKYNELNKILYSHNINYVMVTKNIPSQVLNSYAFNKYTLPQQDDEFLKAITYKKILTSKSGNYELYSTKRKNGLLTSKNLYFKKINSVTYSIYIKNLKNIQDIKFSDSFHDQWKLYPQKDPNLSFCRKTITTINDSYECESEFKFFNPTEMTYLWKNSIPEKTHSAIDGTTNTWKLDARYIKNNFTKEYYKKNKDGSIDVEMVMYFKPQLYLYYGMLISLFTLAGSSVYLIFTKIKKNEKNKKR